VPYNKGVLGASSYCFSDDYQLVEIFGSHGISLRVATQMPAERLSDFQIGHRICWILATGDDGRFPENRPIAVEIAKTLAQHRGAPR
jgi:hypothetical protein